MACLEKKRQIFNESQVINMLQKEKSEDEESIDIQMEKSIFISNVTPNISPRDIEIKISSLKYLLGKDLKAADLRWSLFVAACNTYRYDSCLRPFPPMYKTDECKDIDALRKSIELIPPLAIVFKELHEPNVYENYGAAIDLLYWVLIHLRDPYVKSIDKNNYKSILRKVPSEISVQAPNLIFQVSSTKQSMAEEKWKMASQGRATFYAYHGSRLENFHSILRNGLQQNMCKKSVFGEGIYLSSELGICLPYSPVGYGWGGSVLGSQLSCIALCELIDHPNVKQGNSFGKLPNTSSDNSKVPDKYYLIINSDLVRIRYLLVYSEDFNQIRSDEHSGLLSWFKQHKFLTFVLGYVVLLASVSLAHNKQVEKYYRFLVQKVGLE
ncbi:protein mono-ADP-ribosyltransferase PARP16 isoform X2 [Prorops nasuta]